MQNIRKQVEDILRGFNGMKATLQVLELELDFIRQGLSAEYIENRVFSRSGEETVFSSHISDKTADIAIEGMNRWGSEYSALITQIRNVRIRLNRLEHYISLLPAEEAAVIKWFYFDCLTMPRIVEKSKIAQRTLERRKKNGLDRLVGYYTIAGKFDPDKQSVNAI
ncbi:hypothetical protein FACS1894191_3050 [Clostridia bacterium]|nr:hypothetical protein FACS1894191_3050 [Clostridia bacterium]